MDVIFIGLGSWLKERKEEKIEVKAAEKAAFEKHKEVAKAERQRKAIEEATAKGKEKAYTKPGGLPTPNPKKIAAIKKGLSKLGDKAATAHERMEDGGMNKFTIAPPPTPTRKSNVIKKSAKKKKKSVKAQATGRKKAAQKTVEAAEPEKRTAESDMADYEKKMKEALGY